jgi:hypothetical protein
MSVRCPEFTCMNAPLVNNRIAQPQATLKRGKYAMKMRGLIDLIENQNTLHLPDIEVGDEVMVGKFKNRKATVKGFAKDDHNQPVLKTDKGDQKLFKPRIKKLSEEEDDESKQLAQRLVNQTWNLNDELFSHLLSWDRIVKSPYGASFYDTFDKTWDNTPTGSQRIADHWDFFSKGAYHCQSELPNGRRAGNRWACGTWDGNIYQITLIDRVSGLVAKSVKHDGAARFEQALQYIRSGRTIDLK